MTVFQGSRYEFETIAPVYVGLTNWKPYAIFPSPLPSVTFSFIYRTVQIGDTFQKLAEEVYGDPTLWNILAYANPEIFYPDDLVIGSRIRIPDDPSVF